MLLGPVQGYPRPITVGFDGVHPVLENFIKICQSVLDKPVEALEFLLGVRHFPLQCHHAAIEGFRFFGSSRREGVQHLGQAQWLEQLLDQMMGDKCSLSSAV
jgi:hypothetical protein